MTQMDHEFDLATLSDALAATDVGVWLWDKKSGKVRWSPTMERVFGVKPGTFNGTYEHYVSFLHPDEREEMTQRIQLAMDAKTRFRHEHRIIRPDGSVRWLDGGGKPVVDKSGQVTGMIGTAIDITERKESQAEALGLEGELRRRADELETVLNLVPVGVGVAFDPSCQRVQANPAFAEMLGITPDQNASLTAPPSELPSFRVLKDGQEVPPKELPMQVAAEKGVVIPSTEMEVEWPDGHRLVLMQKAAPLFDEQGAPRGSILAAWDITELKRAQDALLQSERFLGALLQHSYDAVAVVDREAVFKYVSPSVQRVLGYQPEDLVGTNGLALVHPDELSDAQAALARTLASPRQTVEIEFRARRNDGSWRWLEVLGTNLQDDPTVAGVVVNFRDITERKQDEAQLGARLRQQAALAELGNLALAAADPQDVMDQAVSQVSQVLGVEYCKVLDLLPGGDVLLLRAGVGWQDGLVGRATVGTGLDSQAGYTLRAQQPVIVDDLRTETRFRGPQLLRDHNVVSGLSVIIAGDDGPFGVLGAHTTQHRTFTDDDVHFLESVANLIALTVQGYDRNEMISRLSTPVLQIGPRALLVPLVGQMDRARAEQLEDTLLYGIREQRARLVVLDLTGAAVFNQQSIQRLTEAATAARLLGAEVIMTGVSTRLANSFVRLGMDLSNIRMVGDLQSGIREALRNSPAAVSS